MSIRAFDTWYSYLNNDGKLLHGKIRFCNKGTTDNVVIYNSDDTPIRNPSFTDMLGRTEYQVFLDSRDNVTAYFYQYIGTGDMMQWPGEDYDPSRWSYQYSSDSIDPVSRIEIESQAADGVSTMDSLRAKDPLDVPNVDGVKMLWLYGYYNAGDTSPVLYVWDENSSLADNGGSVIQPNVVPGNGRWILSSREYIFDVRHFGIFPVSDKYSTDFSFTSQLAYCAEYLNKEGLNAWFPSLNDSLSYYMFNGTNTFAVTCDIYVSDSVRFCCKSGTTGTVVSCKEMHKTTPYLFDSSVQTGTGRLTADWVNISWLGGQANPDARIGFVIDCDDVARVISGKEVRFDTNGSPSLQLDNCLITSNKKITGNIAISNSIVRTDYFADDYDWSKFSSAHNTFLLENCKDANTYILLKNKQLESDYGDLGEQTIDAVVLNGAILENANGKITISVHGDFEFHNVSLEIDVLNGADSINAVDSWLTINTASTVKSIQLRRGSLNGFGSLRIVQDSLLDNVDIGIPLDSSGSLLTISDSKIRASVTGHDIVLTNNQVYATVEQSDLLGVVTVQCTGNMFHAVNNVAARHYIHPATANSIVNGVWMGNGSSYNTVHWIRLDRTNIDPVDSNHAYTYAGNAEPYLARWSGRNRPFTLYCFGGHKTSSAQGELVFSTSAIPFLFYNNRTRELTVVPRQQYWKMFSVGTQQICRTGHVMCNNIEIGIAEGSYGDHDNGWVPPTFTWGTSSKLVGGQFVGYMECVSRDDPGEADYKVGFEQQFQDHSGMFSYGVSLGIYPSNDFDSGSDETLFPHYPVSDENLVKRTIYVYIDPDFTTGNNPQSV